MTDTSENRIYSRRLTTAWALCSLMAIPALVVTALEFVTTRVPDGSTPDYINVHRGIGMLFHLSRLFLFTHVFFLFRLAIPVETERLTERNWRRLMITVSGISVLGILAMMYIFRGR